MAKNKNKTENTFSPTPLLSSQPQNSVPSLLILVSAGLFLSHFLESSLSQLLCSILTPQSMHCHRGITSITNGLSCGQWQVRGGAGWNGSVQHGSSSCYLLTKGTPAALRSSCCQNPVQNTIHSWSGVPRNTV